MIDGAVAEPPSGASVDWGTYEPTPSQSAKPAAGVDWSSYQDEPSATPTPPPVTPQSIQEDNADTANSPTPPPVGVSGPPVGMRQSGPPAFAPPGIGDGPAVPSAGAPQRIISTMPRETVAGTLQYRSEPPVPMHHEQTEGEAIREALSHPIETLTGADLPSQQEEKQEMLERGASETGDPFLATAVNIQQSTQQPLFNLSGSKTFQGILDPKSKNIFSRVITGGTKGIEALSSPDNIGLLAGMYFAPEEAGQLISAVFSAQMAQGAGSEGVQTLRAAHRGDYGEAAERGANALISAAFAAQSGKHAMGIESSPSFRESAGQGLEEGVRQATGAKGPWADYQPIAPVAQPKQQVAPQDTSRTFTAPANAARQAGVKFDTGPFDFDKFDAAKKGAVQGSTDGAAIRASAEQQHPTLKATVQGAIAGIPGAELEGSRVKSAESMQTKAERGTAFEGMKDVLGLRISVDSPQTGKLVEQAIKQSHPVVGEEPLDANGLKGQQLFVRSGKPGEALQVAEIQILPKPQVDVLDKTTPIYEQQKEAEAAGDDKAAEAHSDKATEIHETALTGELPTKYEFGSTQANLPASSDAAKAVGDMQSRIPDTDLAGDGKDLDKFHVTVRYGLKSGITPELRKFIESQEPFEASLGATTSFPPKPGAEASPIIAPVESPELHKLNAAIEKAGDFHPSDYPDYRPHVTVAFVKPDLADKYTGMTDAKGKTFPIDSIAISDQNGKHTEIPLLGGKSKEGKETAETSGSTQAGKEPVGGRADETLPPTENHTTPRTVPEPGATSPAVPKSEAAQPQEVAPKLTKGSQVTLPDGRTGTLRWTLGKDARVELADKAKTRWDGKLADLKPAEAPPIGKPLNTRIEQIKQAVADGTPVKIFTARADDPRVPIFLKENGLGELPVTNIKGHDFGGLIDNIVNVPTNSDKPFDMPKIPAGKTLYVDLDGTLAKEGGTDATPKPTEAEGSKAPVKAAAEPERGAGKVEGQAKEASAPQSDLAQKREKFKAGKGTKAERETAQRMQELAEHFTPGNVIHSAYWRDYDKVLAFTPATTEHNWSVKVIHSDKEGNPLPDADPRNHSTYPDKGDVIVKRGEKQAPPTPDEPATFVRKSLQTGKEETFTLPGAQTTISRPAEIREASDQTLAEAAKKWAKATLEGGGDSDAAGKILGEIEAEQSRREAKGRVVPIEDARAPKPKIPQIPAMAGMTPLGVKPVAETPAKEDNTAHGDRDQNGGRTPSGGRAPADLPGEDRDAVGAAPARQGEGAEGKGNLRPGSESDGAPVRSTPSGVSEAGVGSGHGAGSGTGLDNSPAGPVAEKAVKAASKTPKLNKDWYTHPDDWEPPSGIMGKLDANMEALRILRNIEKFPRLATPEEQAALANFVGWGALPNVFAPWRVGYSERPRWEKANDELHTLLNEEEYAAASRSTQNAHYTSPELVRYMWDLMKRFGFKGGSVIEPSMGSGNFFGLMPKALRANVEAVGNEMDPVTAGIAKLLYPGATIFNKDFVQLILPDNSLDLAISNVPFGAKVYDPKMPKLNAGVHDYFFVKSLDKVRPGGVVAFITSTGTMDKQNGNIRDIIASKADLIGAIRIPSGAFKKNAGTDVTTDLVILQKRAPGQEPKGPQWSKVVDIQVPGRDKGTIATVKINEYFHDNPEMMLGTGGVSEMYGRDGSFALYPHEGQDFTQLLEDAKRSLPRGIMLADDKPLGVDRASTAAEFAKDSQPEGSFAIDSKGVLKQVVDGKLQAPPVVENADGTKSPAKVERIKQMVGLRDNLNGLLASMTELPDDEPSNAEIAKQRNELKKEYDKFVKRNGILNAPANRIFDDDPHFPRLLALENYDSAKRVATPAQIFTQRTIFPRAELTSLSPDPHDALYQVLAERGRPDIGFMARLQGKEPAEVAKGLLKDGLIFRDPHSGDYEMKEKYLSGYVRDKLDEAKAAVAQGSKEYQANVDALEKVIPDTVPIAKIEVKLGATWIPLPAFSDFISDVLKANGRVTNDGGIWKVSNLANTPEVSSTYGTPAASADWILEQSLNQREMKITYKDSDGVVHVDPQATLLARQKQQKLREAFNQWAADSKKWGPVLEKAFNYAYNNIVLPSRDGSHLTFPGMNASVDLRPHQKDAVWMVIQEGRGLLAHVVGAGKTFEIAASIMEGRRIGAFRKPMLAVPNHLVDQWRSEFMHLYPGAKLLVPTKGDFDSKNRQRLMAKIATGDYDAVILAHSQFNLMDISPERQMKTLQGQMDELVETIRAMKGNRDDERTVKQMEKSKEQLRTRMAKLQDMKADKAISFDETGVDALFIDEAHAYKNLMYYTKMQRVAGLSQGDSKRATRLLMKTQYLQDQNGGRGVVFATGTPIQNTMAEQYTMTKYVAPDVLERAGIKYFDDWAANFGAVQTKNELAADGSSIKARSKFSRFTNVPELMQMFRSFTDIKTAKMLNLPTPKLEGGKPQANYVQPSETLMEYVKTLVHRAKNMPKDPRVDNMLKVVSDGRKAALDMRLVDPDVKDDPDSKINQVVEDVLREWKAGKADKLTQLVFLDMYRALDYPPSTRNPLDDSEIIGRPTERLNLYNDMRSKWIRAGIPADQIAIIGDYDTDVKKNALFAAVNNGDIRILMGSTEKMGAGMNVQRRLKVLHHVDLPWRPGDLAQRTGRIERQGNTNAEVSVKYWLTQRSFDTYMLNTLVTKAEFIEQLMSGTFKGRSIEDLDSTVSMNLQDMMVATSGNPDIKLKYDLEMEKDQLQALERGHRQEMRENGFRAQNASDRASRMSGQIVVEKKALAKYQAVKGEDGKGFSLDVDGKKFTVRKDAFEYLDAMKVPQANFYLTLNGIGVSVKTFSEARNQAVLEYQLEYEGTERTPPEQSMASLGRSIDARLGNLSDTIESNEFSVKTNKADAEKYSKMTDLPFAEAKRLADVKKEIDEVDKRLGMKDEPPKDEVTADIADEDGEADQEVGDQDQEDSATLKPNKAAEERAAKLGSTFSSGLDPTLFKELFPDIAQRVSDWIDNPETNADRMKATIRETRGTMDRRVAVVMHKLADSRKEWSKRSREDSMKFWNAVEDGNVASLDPKDQALANLFKGAFDKMRGQIQQLKPEALRNYIENYFPHLWERQSDAHSVVSRLMNGKRPLQGKASFLKKRTIPTMQDGIDLGFKPKTWNPVESFLTKYAEMAQFLMAHQTIAVMKAEGNAKFVRLGAQPPDGWQQFDDRFASVYRHANILDEDKVEDNTFDKTYVGGSKPIPSIAVEDLPTYGATVLVGHYYGPPDAVKVFNNFVSRGLAGRSGIYDTLNWMNQNLNALQLGISAFHATTTTINAAASDIALGLEQLFRGEPLKAGASFLKAPATVINSFRNGSKLMEAYLSPGSMAKLTEEARAIAQAGGRIQQNTLELRPIAQIANAWRNGEVWEGVKKVPGALLQASIYPVLNWYVPRIKLGAFYQMAHDVLDQAQKNNWPREKTRAMMQRAWDSVDDRFGQVVYDNFFWNKATRDVLQVTNRAVGWNFGSLRTYAGAAEDTARAAGKAAAGEKPEVTPRMAFAFASFMVAGLIGALLTKLWTGKNPQTWKDYLYPTTADGTRHNIPGYPGQVVSMLHAPVQTTVNKMAPIWGLMWDAVQNRDFYGTEIRHKDDPVMKQLLQFGTWASEQAIPFSFSGGAKLLEKRGAEDTLAGLWHAAKQNPGDVLLGQLGFQPSAAFIQNDSALNLAHEYSLSNRTPGTRTKEQAEHSKALAAVEQMYRTGKVDRAAIDRLRKEGKLPGNSVSRAAMESRFPAIVTASRSLSIEQILNVFEKATPEEQKQLRPYVERKSAQIDDIPDPERRQQVNDAFNAAMGTNHTLRAAR